MVLVYESGKLYVEETEKGKKRFEYITPKTMPGQVEGIATIDFTRRSRKVGEALYAICLSASPENECVVFGEKITRRLATDDDIRELLSVWDNHDDKDTVAEWFEGIVESGLLDEEKKRIEKIIADRV